MNDLISKIQNGIKATDADDAYSCGMRNGMRWCISLIDHKEPLYENCPFAQPDCSDCIKHGGDWDCDHVHCHKGESAQPGFNEWCTDCKEYDQEKHCCPRYNRVIREALDEVEKRRTGKWVKLYDDTFHCQLCGHTFIVIQGENSMNFCPSCGARMEEEDE